MQEVSSRERPEEVIVTAPESVSTQQNSPITNINLNVPQTSSPSKIIQNVNTYNYFFPGSGPCLPLRSDTTDLTAGASNIPQLENKGADHSVAGPSVAGPSKSPILEHEAEDAPHHHHHHHNNKHLRGIRYASLPN